MAAALRCERGISRSPSAVRRSRLRGWQVGGAGRARGHLAGVDVILTASYDSLRLGAHNHRMAPATPPTVVVRVPVVDSPPRSPCRDRTLGAPTDAAVRPWRASCGGRRPEHLHSAPCAAPQNPRAHIRRRIGAGAMTTVEAPGNGLPETVPARMVNEFVYCPRLFHLEWVQSRFASNDDVEQGLYVHRVVDQPSGAIPEPHDTHPELLAGRTSRSVWSTSAQLGVSAKIDLVEVSEDGSVVPVDYKKGKPDRNGRPWSSDEIQSVLQALILRDAGYSVSTAEIWYAETRQRVVIQIDDVVATHTCQIVTDMWSVAASDAAPPPLVDSPKCPR